MRKWEAHLLHRNAIYGVDVFNVPTEAEFYSWTHDHQQQDQIQTTRELTKDACYDKADIEELRGAR